MLINDIIYVGNNNIKKQIKNYRMKGGKIYAIEMANYFWR
jgi:hypothetical protein